MRQMAPTRLGYCLAAVLALLVPVACSDHGTDAPSFDVRLQEVFGSAANLASPLDLQAPPGDARLFIAERPGRIRVVENGILLPTPFLDISSRVFTDGEGGLLSFAFHPQFGITQPFVFVHFIEGIPNANGDIVVERYRVSADPNQIDISSAELVIRIPHHDFSNHFGGRVAFGLDGMLYLSTGDGGGNLGANSQDATAFLGKVLRLDVSTLPYAIPLDNPIWPNATQPNENWAIGLRNPFRYVFDAPSARLYIADVGEAQREEVNVVAANASGINYGWNSMEGTLCRLAIPCPPSLTLPVIEYDHSQGCAIIGGYVYRGAAIPELQGQYLFSDVCGGFVRALRMGNGTVTVKEISANAGGIVLSFGQDGFGEVYLMIQDGRVLRIARQ